MLWNEGIFVSIICFFVMVIGGIISYFVNSLKHKYEYEIFSSGFLLGVALFILIPGGYSENFSVYVIMGMFLVLIIERILAFCPLGENYCLNCGVEDELKIRLIYLTSFFLHTFIDGIIIAITFTGNLGITPYLAIVLHKLPAGFVLLSPLKSYYKNKAIIIGALVSFGTVLGTVAGLQLIPQIPMKPIISFSGGIFASTSLLLTSHATKHNPNVYYAFLGVLIAGLISFF